MGFERYESRFQAGEILANEINLKNEDLYYSMIRNPTRFFCFAVPNGGVPVVEGFCSKFNMGYDMLIVRKIETRNTPPLDQ